MFYPNIITFKHPVVNRISFWKMKNGWSDPDNLFCLFYTYCIGLLKSKIMSTASLTFFNLVIMHILMLNYNVNTGEALRTYIRINQVFFHKNTSKLAELLLWNKRTLLRNCSNTIYRKIHGYDWKSWGMYISFFDILNLNPFLI